MQIGFKYKYCRGFARLYNYAYKHNCMITKTAQERYKILLFWRQFGLPATTSAYGASRSTLYAWWQAYQKSGSKIESLNPSLKARKNTNKRIINPLILAEIKRLRLELCPNMGKAKVKILLDKFCIKNSLPVYSESKIGRIIKEKKIKHIRTKYYPNGKEKIIKKEKKTRKPKGFVIARAGDLVEIDTVVRFEWGIKRYILTAVDLFGRPAFAYCYKRATSANAKDFFAKLETALPFPIRAVQTDNGSEFHKYFKDYLKERKVKHFWNYPGQPYRNGHIERFNRSIQNEFIDDNEVLLTDTHKFNRKLMDWLIWYNTERPHWSLRLQSPIDFLINNSLLSRKGWTDTLP